MDSCPACRAFLQPDWDRCKICGHVLGTPVETGGDTAGPGRKRRRKGGRRGAGETAGAATPAPRRASAPAPAAPTRPAPSAPPRATATRPSVPAAAGLPPLFADDGPAPAPEEANRRSRARWVVAGLVVLAAVAVAVVVLGAEDGDDPYSDRPAAESAEPVEDQPAWERFAVGPASVELPAPPFVEDRAEQILVIGQVSLTTAEVISGGLTYTVAVGALPDGVRQRDPDELLERMVDRWATAEAGRVAASEQVTVGGAPALRVRIAGLERDLDVVAVVDGGVLAELRVAGQDPDPAAIQRLIDSFDA